MKQVKVASWHSPKVYVAESSIAGRGLFAKETINKDEVIGVKAGHIIEKEVFDSLPEICKRASLQVSDTHFVAPLTPEEAPRVMHYVNHSCNPNVGIKGHLETVAMRKVLPGEELTGDYCVAYSNDHFSFTCNCQSSHCRKEITAHDWKDLGLHKKYKGYFSQYVQEKIDKLSTSR
jgi:hypothetical protein